ncbi:unnamed protein product [Gongylonema pulchrum]|uniref:Importin N-terminal domain-containing protein n=1 Tax=Gongylonema pulchrum TaxID=637853 RepID=A0A183E190_9BILA|nr:unnamed protein product [Gongylonema pulchrum]
MDLLMIFTVFTIYFYYLFLRWLALPVDVREFVKQNVVQTLGTEQFRPSVAAQCVAAIACAEIPEELWPNVIDHLKNNVITSNNEVLRESSLEALGYICQDISGTKLESQANLILTAIVHGLRKDEPSNHIRLAAANAMMNSLEFTKENFNREVCSSFFPLFFPLVVTDDLRYYTVSKRKLNSKMALLVLP